MVGRSGVGVASIRLLDETVAGRGLDEGHAVLTADRAELALRFVVSDKVVLEDHLQDRSPIHRNPVHLPDLLSHKVPIRAQHLADIGHDVELFGPVGHGELRFPHLEIDATVAVRESHYRTDHDVGTRQHLVRQRHRIGFDAHRCHVTPKRNFTPVLELQVGHCGVEQRVVDHLGYGANTLRHDGPFPVGMFGIRRPPGRRTLGCGVEPHQPLTIDRGRTAVLWMLY